MEGHDLNSLSGLHNEILCCHSFFLCVKGTAEDRQMQDSIKNEQRQVETRPLLNSYKQSELN